MYDIADSCWHQEQGYTLCKALLGVHVQERVCASVYLCRVNLSDPPVLHLCGGVLDPRLHQDALILALLVQPLMALEDVTDV